MTESEPASNQLSLIDTLDMKLSISVDPGTDLSEMSRKFGMSGEVGFTFSGELPEVVLAFPNSAEQYLELRIFFQKFDAVEHGGVWRIRRQVTKATRQFECIRSLLEVPSMVLVSAYLSGGSYHIEFIFHHDDLEVASHILLEAVRDSSDLKIDYIGHSPGFREILSSIDSRKNLSVLEIGLTPPEEETKPENAHLGDRWTRIAKMPFGAEKISAVYFLTDDVKRMKWVRHAVTSNSFVNYINMETNKARILTLARIYEHDRPNFTIITILPTTMSHEFVSLISESAKDMPEWKPVLRRIMGIREWVER